MLLSTKVYSYVCSYMYVHSHSPISLNDHRYCTKNVYCITYYSINQAHIINIISTSVLVVIYNSINALCGNYCTVLKVSTYFDNLIEMEDLSF